MNIALKSFILTNVLVYCPFLWCHNIPLCTCTTFYIFSFNKQVSPTALWFPYSYSQSFTCSYKCVLLSKGILNWCFTIFLFYQKMQGNRTSWAGRTEWSPGLHLCPTSQFGPHRKTKLERDWVSTHKSTSLAHSLSKANLLQKPKYECQWGEDGQWMWSKGKK